MPTPSRQIDDYQEAQKIQVHVYANLSNHLVRENLHPSHIEFLDVSVSQLGRIDISYKNKTVAGFHVDYEPKMPPEELDLVVGKLMESNLQLVASMHHVRLNQLLHDRVAGVKVDRKVSPAMAYVSFMNGHVSTTELKHIESDEFLAKCILFCDLPRKG